YITDIGYYPKAQHHYRHRNPPIGQYVFIYCIDGCGWFELNGTTYEVSANQYFILPAGVPHTYASSDSNPWTIYWAHFSGTTARHFVEPDPSPQTIAPGLDSRISDRINIFEEIYSTLDDSFAIENIRYAVSLFHHFLESMRYLNLYRKVGNRKHDSDVIESTIHYMAENVERRLSLNDIADYSGFSPSYLSSMFKKRTGYSPVTYFNLLKIRKACELINTTSMKLTQISFKLGFDDQFYFSRLFNKMMGMSPKAYRALPKS
ncbi:MAG: AraC family transcriptional regulator, partial [Muribaculaceae bacterium]|nr:AraC family transcriptional regulator [Muribaculaceae bacterium]